ncbi:hypothetical protein [Streptomyces atriruber]|uniref:hypothetical protein n=1 Tax=Streptomyces atriruber TaxID=545121 RepID=UPI0006E15C51|nr:hypothetical protein [Streptomyces atriruber]
MATTRKPREVDPHAATEVLMQALEQAGIVLPSLRVDSASPNLGLIQLGGVRAEVAMRLAETIRRGGRDG